MARSGPTAAPVSGTADVRACSGRPASEGKERPTASTRWPAAFQSSTAALSESRTVRCSSAARAVRAASPGCARYVRIAGWSAAPRTSAVR